MTVSPTTITYGQALNWSVSGCTPNASVQAAIQTQPNGGLDTTGIPAVMTDANGNASGSITVGQNVSAGNQELIVTDTTTGQTGYANWILTTTTPPPTTSISPSVTVSPSTLTYGQVLSWSASGFTPNAFIQPQIHTLPSGGYDETDCLRR